MKSPKTVFVILVFFCVAVIRMINCGEWAQKTVLKWDASGYYLFLPATFIHHDLGKLSFYPYLDSVYKPADGLKNYALFDQPETGRRSDKYAIGVALGELPLFFAAHIYTLYFTDAYPADGYSEPYQLGVAVSNILWSVIGLWVLGRFLRRYRSDTVTAFTLLLVSFGTNFYCYTIHDQGMSHCLLFLLFSCVLYFTERWYTLRRMPYAFWLGFFLGWTMIARPVDILVILVPLLWPLPEGSNKRLAFWWQHRSHLLLCVLGCFLVCSIQLAYWKYVSGHLVYFSYEGETFNFGHPEILNGLFSFRKGWFIYTPLAFIAFLGFIPLFRGQKQVALLLLLFFLLDVYVVFSWSNWWYGWGFGARAMVESLALLSIPLAALIAWIGSRRIAVKSLGVAVGLFLVWLNLYQTEQYNMGAIQGDNMNYEFYWRVWNKMHPSEEDWKYFNK